MQHRWHERSGDRLPDQVWQAAVARVRGEFEEMPCLCVDVAQARALFGLPERTCEGVLRRLESDGFLDRTRQGGYMRRR